MTRVPAAMLGLLIVSALGGISAARAAEPKLDYLVPAAAASGQSIELDLHGSTLADPAGLWTNIPGAKLEPVPPRSKKETPTTLSRWRLSVPSGTPLGYYGLRLATKSGISNLRLLMIDDLPTLAETGSNKTPQSAQQVSLPIALEGTAEAESYDYFRFRAERGQRLSVEVVARRLGSPMDPVVRLLRVGGGETELAYSDDDEALGADGRLTHTFAAAGDYLLELRDIRYQGGADYRYRLRIGDFPLATAAYPAAVQRGARTELQILGRELDELPPLSMLIAADKHNVFTRTAVRYESGQGSTPLVVGADETPQQVELEPNDTLETATPIELVGAVNGRFELPHDRDYFSFNAKKGEHWLLAGRTRSLGLPTDLFLRLYDSAGKQLSEVEDTAGDEGTIDFNCTADGTYRLMVEDLLNRGGPEQVYRIEISRYRPGFTLSVDAEKVTVPQRGVLAVKVTAVRRGYKGPIELALVGKDLPFLETKKIEGKKDTVLVAPISPDAKPGQFGMFQVVGRAKVDGQEFSAIASNAAALRTALAGLVTLPPDLDGQLAYGVGPVLEPFFEVKPQRTKVDLLQLAGSATLNVKAKRKGKFLDAIALTIDGLPPGISTKPVSIEKGKTEANIEFTAPAALAPAMYDVRLLAKGTFDNQPAEIAIPLQLQMVRPLAIEVITAGRLARGKEQPIRIRVTRAGGDKQPIQLAWHGLPKDVHGQSQLTIPAGKDEIETSLKATADARLAPVDCSLVALLKIGDKTVSIASPAVRLVIDK